MKKYKGAVVLLVIAIIVAVFVACSSKPTYTEKEVVLTQAVTDESGQAVTDANGEVVTEQIEAPVVTNSNGETVTEVVTQSNGNTVTTPNGNVVTQAVTAYPSTTSISMQSGDDGKDESPKADDTTKKNSKNDKETTKKNNKKDKETTKEKKDESTTKKPSKQNETKPNKTTTTTTTTEPTTLPPTTAAGQTDINEKDIIVKVVMPYFANEDSNHYNLYVKIGDDTLKYPIKDGCRGQEIELTIPKKYKGKKAIFTINVQGKEYTIEGKISNNLEVEFETIIIVTGEDD